MEVTFLFSQWLLPALLALWVTVAGHTPLVNQPPPSVSGFYVDNGLQQTVLLESDRISAKHRREIRQEILTILGLHRRPRPLSHPKQKSAPRYMLQLYNSLLQDQEDRLESLQNHQWIHLVDNMTMPGMERKVGHADLIMSFVNQGIYCSLYVGW